MKKGWVLSSLCTLSPLLKLLPDALASSQCQWPPVLAPPQSSRFFNQCETTHVMDRCFSVSLILIAVNGCLTSPGAVPCLTRPALL